ncbi:MAG: hypothetical protein QNJ72_25950 [Pleurocapsa sp. MO_226.B13]|nr:hypothetical protein [Pleurocapsa sp. MO_226.B13]
MFVIIEKNQKSVPSDEDITKAMKESGGTVTKIEGNNSSKKVTFTGDVDHNTFQNNLEKVAKGKKTSWNFVWADSESSIVQFSNLTAEEAAATDFSVTITMNQTTVDDLNHNKFILYAFKAVQTTAQGAPVVWFQTTNYALNTVISWSEEYQAYTSKSQIIPNGQIVASNSYPISLDQTLEVTSSTGTGNVDASSGTPGAISIHNQTTTQFTCGISQQQMTGNTTPLCAFPLFGGNLNVIAPIEKVLLMFSTQPVNTGTVIFQAYSPAVLIDLTGVTSRQVSYEINQGWSADGAPWATNLPATTNLVPFLIESASSSSSLVKRHLQALQAA